MLGFLLFCAVCEWFCCLERHLNTASSSAPKTKKAGYALLEKPFSGRSYSAGACELTVNQPTTYVLNKVMYRLVDKNMTKGSQDWASYGEHFP